MYFRKAVYLFGSALTSWLTLPWLIPSTLANFACLMPFSFLGVMRPDKMSAPIRGFCLLPAERPQEIPEARERHFVPSFGESVIEMLV